VDTPLYEHDCEGCVYLGRFDDDTYHERELDLYFCGSQWGSTVVARYSDSGPDYHSGLEFVGKIPALTEAWQRAVDRHIAAMF
jgi:hypothetical protein